MKEGNRNIIWAVFLALWSIVSTILIIGFDPKKARANRDIAMEKLKNVFTGLKFWSKEKK